MDKFQIVHGLNEFSTAPYGVLRVVHMTWMLIPAILRMAWLCRKHWRVLHGR